MNSDLAFLHGAAAWRRARPALVVAALLGVALLVVAVWLLPNPAGLRVASWALALFAALGVFALILAGLGLLRLSRTDPGSTTGEEIAKASEDGIVATDAKGAIVFANASYRRLCGEKNDDLRPVERLFAGSPEVSESVYRLAQAARARQTGNEELRLNQPLGGGSGSAWYRVRLAPLGDKSDARMLWTISDVTRERVRHETFFQDLQRAIDYLDHAPAGFFSADADGGILHLNATLAQWLNYDLAKFQLGTLTLADMVAPESLFQLEIPKAKPGEVTTATLDVDMKPRGGRLLPVRILHRVAYSGDGVPGPSRSLVLRRDAGAGLVASAQTGESRFARIFYSTPMGIATVDKAGAALRWNPAFAKLSPATLQAANASSHPSILNLVPERDRPALLSAIAAASEGHEGIEPVDAALEGDGKRSARFYVSATETQTEEESAATVFALDTTEQRTLQESFAQSQKMQAIGQLAGGIAHDFNNVLTAIIGYSDLLLANHRPTDPSFQDIMQIKQNANRAAGLVRQLLAFSRRQTLRPQVLQLGEVLSDLQLLLNRLVGETIKLDVVHGRDLWLVKADQNQFEQVIVNLVVNARDAIGEGGVITLRTRNIPPQDCAAFNEQSLVAADYVLVEVQDTGHGIPADVRSKIFEPFFTTKEVGKGTGLGLAMVYGIVKQTGGYVFVESEPEKGATFRLLLPRHERTEADEPVKKDAPKPTVDLTGRGAILLVEDEEAVRSFASRALASRGYTVLQADTGLDALRVVEENKGAIDLIVSDVIMPEMDGPTMLLELRKRGVKAKVIFVSGYADDAFAKSLPEGQEFIFLPKPFTLKQLIETVKTATSSG
jgi:two-component system, cell cycle sensor histidine kinase and response regulator CckA